MKSNLLTEFIIGLSLMVIISSVFAIHHLIF